MIERLIEQVSGTNEFFAHVIVYVSIFCCFVPKAPALQVTRTTSALTSSEMSRVIGDILSECLPNFENEAEQLGDSIDAYAEKTEIQELLNTLVPVGVSTRQGSVLSSAEAFGLSLIRYQTKGPEPYGLN